MKPHFSLTAALVALALATPALADKGKGNRHDERHVSRHAQAWCPPGLAKKSPACVPPGQAKKHAHRDRDWRDRDRWSRDRDWDRDWDRERDRRWSRDWDRYRDRDRRVRIGDRIDDRWLRIDPRRYGLNPAYRYYSDLGQVFRVDPNTLQVLAFVGLLDALLN